MGKGTGKWWEDESRGKIKVLFIVCFLGPHRLFLSGTRSRSRVPDGNESEKEDTSSLFLSHSLELRYAVFVALMLRSEALSKTILK